MTERNRPGHTDTSIDDAAALWYARHDAGLSPLEQAEFDRWVNADPRHAEIWADYRELLAPLSQLPRSETGSTALRVLATRQRRRRWRVLAGSSAGIMAAAAAIVLLLTPAGPFQPGSDSAAGSALVVAKPERRELPDGSSVDLNAGATIDVAFTPGRRGVRLVQGEAHFTVAPNPERPFVVEVQGIQVRAVGTAFAVRSDAAAVNVVVTHGRVAVARVDQTTPPVFADAGSRVSISVAAAPSVDQLDADDLARQLAWRGPRLELTGTTLAEAIPVFNRESRIQLRIGDATIAKMRMSGVFRADNAEGFARMLEANYDVRLEHAEGAIVLQAAR